MIRYDEMRAFAATRCGKRFRKPIPIIHPIYFDTIIGHVFGGNFTPRFPETWYARSLARNAITSYDGIISARGAGQGEDYMLFKNTSITPAAAAVWYSLLRAAGIPPAVSPSGVTGGSVMNKAS